VNRNTGTDNVSLATESPALDPAAQAEYTRLTALMSGANPPDPSLVPLARLLLSAGLPPVPESLIPEAAARWDLPEAVIRELSAEVERQQAEAELEPGA